MTTDFENKMLKLLEKSNIVEHIYMSDVLDDVDSSILLRFLEMPCKVEAKDDGLFFIDDDGSIHECPNFGISIPENGCWLSSKIPECPFNIEQAGNIRKAEEAECAYYLSIICLVLKDDIYFKELKDIILSYDFENMDGTIHGKNFRFLLTEWQNYQSMLINISVSTAKYNLSNVKKSTEKFLKDGIPSDAVLELRELERSVKNVNRKYSMTILLPMNIKSLNKIEILEALDKRDNEITKLVNDASKVTVLYKLLNLSIKFISA